MNSSFWSRLDSLARHVTPFAMTMAFVLAALIPFRPVAAADVAPAFALMSVYYWALHQPDLLPAPCVFIVGLLQDVLTGAPIGISAFLLLVVYGVVVSQQRFFIGKSFHVIWWGFAMMAYASSLLHWLLAMLYLGIVISPLPVLYEATISTALYPLLAYVFYLTHRTLQREA